MRNISTHRVIKSAFVQPPTTTNPTNTHISVRTSKHALAAHHRPCEHMCYDEALYTHMLVCSVKCAQIVTQRARMHAEQCTEQIIELMMVKEREPSIEKHMSI